MGNYYGKRILIIKIVGEIWHLIKNLFGWFCLPIDSRCQLLFTKCKDHLWGGPWKCFEGEAKQLVFEVSEKQ